MKKLCCMILTVAIGCCFNGCFEKQSSATSQESELSSRAQSSATEPVYESQSTSEVMSEAISSSQPVPPSSTPDKDHPVGLEPPSTPPDSNLDSSYMEEIRVAVVDKSGYPVSNLCINLEYTSGREGSYTPGDAMTKSTGAVMRKAHPANYNVIITDRNQLDYSGASQRNQMVLPISVIEGGVNEFSFIWEYPTPLELDLTTSDKVILTFVDKKGEPVKDLWVSVFPKEDKSPEPRQITPGITDQNGRVYWTNYEIGWFNAGALFSTTEGDGPYIHGKDTYSFEITGPEEFTFTWEPVK